MNYREYLLACLAEGCAEVAQRAIKALRFGPYNIQDGQSLNNTERINVELTDLWAVVELLEECGWLESALDSDAINTKKVKVLKSAKYSEECGPLESDLDLFLAESRYLK